MLLDINHRVTNHIQEFAVAAAVGAWVGHRATFCTTLQGTALLLVANAVEKVVLYGIQKWINKGVEPCLLMRLSAKVISFGLVVGVTALVTTASLAQLAASLALGMVIGVGINLALYLMRALLFPIIEVDPLVARREGSRPYTEQLKGEEFYNVCSLSNICLDHLKMMSDPFSNIDWVVKLLEKNILEGKLTNASATAVLFRVLKHSDHRQWKNPTYFGDQGDPVDGFLSNFYLEKDRALVLKASSNFNNWFVPFARRVNLKKDSFMYIHGVTYEDPFKVITENQKGGYSFHIKSIEQWRQVKKFLVIAEHRDMDDETRAKCYWAAILTACASTPGRARKVAKRVAASSLKLNLSKYLPWYQEIQLGVEYSAFRQKFPKGDRRLLQFKSPIFIELARPKGPIPERFNLSGKSLLLRAYEIHRGKNISFLCKGSPCTLLTGKA